MACRRSCLPRLRGLSLAGAAGALALAAGAALAQPLDLGPLRQGPGTAPPAATRPPPVGPVPPVVRPPGEPRPTTAPPRPAPAGSTAAPAATPPRPAAAPRPAAPAAAPSPPAAAGSPPPPATAPRGAAAARTLTDGAGVPAGGGVTVVWATFRDPRFGTTLQYPGNMFRVSEPPADGRAVLTAADGATITVITRANSEGFDRARLEQAVRQNRAPGDEILYDERGQGSLLLVGRRGGTRYVEYHDISRDGAVIGAMVMAYPDATGPLYDALAARVSRTFKTAAAPAPRPAPAAAPPRPAAARPAAGAASPATGAASPATGATAPAGAPAQPARPALPAAAAVPRS